MQVDKGAELDYRIERHTQNPSDVILSEQVRLIQETVTHPIVWILEANYLPITTVVQELRNFGRSRAAATRICSFGRSPRMIGQ